MEQTAEPTLPAAMPQEIIKQKEALSLYRIAVIALAVVAVLGVLGAIALSLWARPVPESLVALAGVALGALAGMVAPAQGGTP
jgi:anti-sigma-K factor RskA